MTDVVVVVVVAVVTAVVVPAAAVVVVVGGDVDDGYSLSIVAVVLRHIIKKELTCKLVQR